MPFGLLLQQRIHRSTGGHQSAPLRTTFKFSAVIEMRCIRTTKNTSPALQALPCATECVAGHPGRCQSPSGQPGTCVQCADESRDALVEPAARNQHSTRGHMQRVSIDKHLPCLLVWPPSDVRGRSSTLCGLTSRCTSGRGCRLCMVWSPLATCAGRVRGLVAAPSSCGLFTTLNAARLAMLILLIERTRLDENVHDL
jgi:hypothetical protein